MVLKLVDISGYVVRGLEKREAVIDMPTGRCTASEEDEEGIFQSPEWDPDLEHDHDKQGASPKLRRSSRKRKSTAADDNLLKVSESKKKKEMPKVNRSPLRASPRTQAKANPLRPSS